MPRLSYPAVLLVLMVAAPVLTPEAGAQSHTVAPIPATLKAEVLYGSTLGAARTGAVSDGPVRHPAAAFGLSALLPGAGQAYNRQWVKAAVLIGVEAALAAGYVITRNRGLEQEDEFQEFAHEAWSPARYASWLNDYRTYLVDELGVNISAMPVDIPSGIDFSMPDAWSDAERRAVSSMISDIRAIERQAIHPETGAAFSHQLPGFGEQQYYELIGKYFQFAPGWEDYPEWTAADGSFTRAIDPELTGPGGTKPNVSSTFYAYAADHADAQDILRTASRMSIFFVINHLVAGIDAAVTAKLRADRASQSRVSTDFGVAYTPDGMPAPTAALQIRF